MMGYRLFRSLSALVSVGLAIAAGAQAEDAGSHWQPVRASALTAQPTGQRVLLTPPRTLRLDQDGFLALLDRTPMEGTVAAEAGEAVFELPLPDGGYGRFRIEESPIMGPDLAARFPEIRTFRGHGIDDPTASVRFDWTPAGFHAMVLSAGGTFLIDPYADGDTAHYVTYHKKDYRRRDATPFRCLVKGTEIDEAELRDELARAFGSPVAGGAFGDQLRTYRLALAATGEYTALFGGQANAFAAMATTLNRVNGIYEREVAVHVNLVTGTEIVYANGATDPYTDEDGVAMLCQNQCTIDSVTGQTNYDIGHVFSTGGGGVAALGSTCNNMGQIQGLPCDLCPGLKARGVTGLPNPTGDVFAVDFVAHEMGHQFGANHTFNGTTGNCGGGNRNDSTAYEPGSGSTIMAYSGICGSQDVQINADDYFHAKSLDEINSFISNAGNCAATSGTNNPPTVIAPTSFTIPKQTPFTLTATSATDPNGDTVTVGWEEFDLGQPSPPDDDVGAIRPIFRSFDPGSSLSRTFPSLPNILNGTNAGPFEKLPTRSRTMVFRVTARDNHGGQGGTSFDTTNVVVSGTSGPFAVTSPNTGVTWSPGTTQTVTWSVNGTSGSPVSCANVKITLSTDGGQTFPIVLIASTPNDGTQAITVPNVSTSSARVKVEAVGNIFFDISNTNFSIAFGLSVSDATPVTEGNAGTTTATFTVSLLQTSAQQIKVNYATANGTAAAGTDYVATSGTLTFNPGDLTKNVPVAVNGDTLFEIAETFVLNLSAPVNAVISDAQGTATILNDDTAPTVSINDVSVTEGNAGTKNAVLTVSLSTVSGATTTVDYTTADGTTTAGSDYVAVVGATLSIPAGLSSRSLNIAIKGDCVIEPSEMFLVNLTIPDTNATIADGQGEGTILNDDSPGTFQFSVANYTVSEAVAAATIKITRVNGNAAGASVDYEITDGTAVFGSDYGAPVAGTKTFSCNQASTTFTVPIVKDTLDEQNETVLLRLHNPQSAAEGAALGVQRTAVLTINDNDKPGTIKLSSASYSVGEAGPTATITVRRSGGVASPVTVDYTAAPGTASDAGDFTTAFGTLTFGPSGAAATTQTFSVPIGPNDGVAEGAETVLITLSAPSGGAVLGSPSSGVLTIVDDEPTVWFSAASYSAKETAAGALITVKRSGPLTSILNVDYLASDAGATVNADYKPTAGTLTFAPNVSTRTLLVGLLKDTLVEGPESVALTLSNPTPGTSLGTAPGSVTPGAASLTILDDDKTPTVQFSAATYTVSEASPKAIVTVKRSGSLGGTVTVDYAASDITTTNGPAGDYDLPPGTLTFLPGKTVQTITVPILPDAVPEGTETALLTLSMATATNGTATIAGTNPATLRITDNEPTVQFTAASYKVSEAATKATILVRRTGVVSAAASVDYQITGGTATNGVDYTLAISGTLSFNAGAATTPLVIPLTMDKVDEPNETVILTLSNPSPSIELGTPEMTTLTITDNDVAGKVQFSVANYSVSEDGGTVNLTVNRTLGTSELATIDYDVTGGTATNSPTAGFDYTLDTLGAGTLTFNPGVKSITIPVAITEDASVEGNESVIVTLSNPGGGLSIGTIPQATLWIVEND